MSSSDMPIWEFDNESDANAKAAELNGSDFMNRVIQRTDKLLTVGM